MFAKRKRETASLKGLGTDHDWDEYKAELSDEVTAKQQGSNDEHRDDYGRGHNLARIDW